MTIELQQVYEQYGAALVLYARQWCTDPEDALQEALLELMRQPTEPIDVIAWLFRAVRFRAMNQSRSDTRRNHHHYAATLQLTDWFTADPTLGLEVEELKRALQELHQLEREIVIARIWGGLSFEQIAQVVDRSSSAVHRRFMTALKTLQQTLEGHRKPSHTHER